MSSNLELKSEARAEKAAHQVEDDLRKLRKVLAQAGVSMAQSELRNKAGISNRRWPQSFAAALDRGVITEVPGKRTGSHHYALAA